MRSIDHFPEEEHARFFYIPLLPCFLGHLKKISRLPSMKSITFLSVNSVCEATKLRKSTLRNAVQ